MNNFIISCFFSRCCLFLPVEFLFLYRNGKTMNSNRPSSTKGDSHVYQTRDDRKIVAANQLQKNSTNLVDLKSVVDSCVVTMSDKTMFSSRKKKSVCRQLESVSSCLEQISTSTKRSTIELNPIPSLSYAQKRLAVSDSQEENLRNESRSEWSEKNTGTGSGSDAAVKLRRVLL